MAVPPFLARRDRIAKRNARILYLQSQKKNDKLVVSCDRIPTELKCKLKGQIRHRKYSCRRGSSPVCRSDDRIGILGFDYEDVLMGTGQAYETLEIEKSVWSWMMQPSVFDHYRT
ncbi:hypothetical protein RHMOL_Rhmol04G0104200 [Rhododendron molle]|uniref:Uncharacterized protein n=1 Tax=Rhododendron molle TaxID=49168 RepID=A0ACC0P061_RHOML|nr:hypothetical protein RHMOL_Rhmol04G0104200 [Rhododendron molle]